jgi:hypothetical protein
MTNFVETSISKFQAIIRGRLCRSKLKKSSDPIDYEMVCNMLESYKSYYKSILEINKYLTSKKMRYPNFPSEISENIVKLAIYQKYKIMPTWDTKVGDLEILAKKRIEVKAFSSNGPTSFGPKEKWDFIYFLDAINFMKSEFIIYECKCSNKSLEWCKLKINSKQTFEDQCLEGKRPRIVFKEILNQLENKFTIIFKGKFEDLCI